MTAAATTVGQVTTIITGAVRDVAGAVGNAKGGEVQFKAEKAGVVHAGVGKASFDETKLVENYQAALEEILRLKPSASKGRYIVKATMSTTMGPGIPLDHTRTKALLEEAAPVAAAEVAEQE